MALGALFNYDMRVCYFRHIDLVSVVFFWQEMVGSIETGSDDVSFIRIGEEILRLDLEELNEEYLEKSRKELRENPENVRDAVAALRNLLKGFLNVK